MQMKPRAASMNLCSGQMNACNRALRLCKRIAGLKNSR
jgi:hypothetical protein